LTTKAHSLLTGSDLHEPKGVSTAIAGQVYISDGAGSGSWTDTGATIGASSFSTGDLKPTIKTTPDSGWIMCDDGTIGDLSSGASNLASASTQDLFTLLWNGCANTEAAVSSGRGVSASADFAAHKTIALPKMLGRVYGVAGAGSGLTSRALGKTVGEETHALTAGETGPHTHTFSGTTTIESGLHSHNYFGDTANGVTGAQYTEGGTTAGAYAMGTTSTQTANHTHTYSGTTTTGGSGTGHNNIQPTVFLNMMIKL